MLIDALAPAIGAYQAATSGQTPLEANIDLVTDDPRVRMSMRMGSILEGGNLVGGWGVGDNGSSFGPFQIHLPAHPGVTRDQAEDPQWAATYMAPYYINAVNKVPPQLWQTDPAQAAALATYYAESPAEMYDPQRVDEAWGQVGSSYTLGSQGEASYDMGTPAPNGTPTPNPGGGGGSGGGGNSSGQFSPGDFGGGGTTTRYQKVPSSYGYPLGTSYDPVSGQYGTVDASGTFSAYPADYQPGGNTINALRSAQASAALQSAATGAANAGTAAATQQETARQNRVQDAINYINQLVASQQTADTQAKNSADVTMAALPYLTKAANFPGFGPNDPAVRAGLVPVTAVQGTPMPQIPQGMGAIPSALAQIAAMAGVR